MDLVTRLDAIERIKFVKAQYFQAIDLRDWDLYMKVFTPDAVIDYSDHARINGRDEPDPHPEIWVFQGPQAAMDFIKPAFGEVASAHQGTNPQVTVTDENTASALWALQDRLEFPTETYFGYGHYHEDYLRVDGEWRISKLVLSRLFARWVPRG